MASHFCVCPAADCPRHPRNQPEGCDPCIRDNLAKGKIPACFFHAVRADMTGATDYSMRGFVDYFLRHADGASPTGTAGECASLTPPPPCPVDACRWPISVL